MKKLKLITLLLLSLTLMYCSSDDENSEEEQQQDNQEETTPLDANTVLNGIYIEGATVINDAPPQATGNLSFSIAETSTALVNEGFSIEFNSSDPIAGAYLIISDVDGNNASSYLDVPESAFDFTSQTDRKFNNNRKGKSKGSDNSNLLIDFLDSLNAGIFCYSLCVYDINGNISQPQTACVTIQSLGGNNNLVDYWNLVRYQESYDNMNTDVGLNEDICYQNQLYCINGGTLNFESCYEIDNFYIEFFEDGIYRLFLQETDDNINYEASENSCNIISSPDTLFEYTSEGVWAYNEADNKLLMAEYFARYVEDGEVYEEFYGAGNAQLLFDAPISLSGNTFVLTLDYSYDGMEDIEIYTFQK